MDAQFSWQRCTAREWLHRLAETGNRDYLMEAFDSALAHLEHYEAERDAARRLSDERSKLRAEASASKEYHSTRPLDDNRRELFSALARQITAQEKLRLAVNKCSTAGSEQDLPLEREKLLVWLESQAEMAQDEVQMHQLLSDHQRSS